MKSRSPRRASAVRLSLTLTASALVLGTLVQGSALFPGAGPDDSSTDKGKTVVGKAAEVLPRKTDRTPKLPVAAPKAQWPRAGSAVLDIAPAPQGGSAGWHKVGNTTISLVAAPGAVGSPPPAAAWSGRTAPVVRAEVKVLGRASAQRAGVNGLLLSITPQRTPGDPRAGEKLALGVDYTAFSGAFGGGYASRLGLSELPSCALTAPSEAKCRKARQVPTKNDEKKRILSTSALTLKAGFSTLVAAQPEASGDKGDYKATSLAPSATWKTDLNMGDFAWSYKLPVPEVPGGLKPSLGIGYSSSSIDGRTGGTNNQASWVGDGFALWPGFIERRYKPCAEDGVTSTDGNKPGDLCWAYDNAVLSLNGKAGDLVPAGGDEWKLKEDDGTRITRLTGTERGNGDADNEYWRVTAPDGTSYYFGYHKLNGWSSGKDTTDSVWTVPVYGNDDGEPCHKSTFKDSWCQQGWRWNLDYAVDPRGNATAYYYGKETNSYGRNLEPKDATPYTRGGYLKRIEYGLGSANLYAKPLAKVDFTNAERCLPQTDVTCAEDTIDDKKEYWYDTPWDLNCKDGTECNKGRMTPSFWTRKRLTEVTTQVLQSDGSYAPVDTWKLSHRWGMADTDYQLLLDSIQHTGRTGTPAVTLPKTTFAYAQRPNRLDKTGDGKAPFIKERLATIADESGGQIDVNYSAPECSWDKLPTPESNTTRCFPQYIGGSSSDDPTQQWFNKYVVDSVTSTDRTGGAPDQVTRYEYLDGAAWHFDDDDGLTKEKFKTWSTWRGYGHVRVETGAQGSGGMKTRQDSYFLRGMDGDRKSPTGGTKSIVFTLGPNEGEPITDHASAAGFSYRTEKYSAPDGKVLEKTVNRPWHHETAKRERSWGTVTSNFTGIETAQSFTSLDSGAGQKWRRTATTTAHDTVAGRAVMVDDQGDTSTLKDDRCTRTTYADNTTSNILNLPSRVETVAVACDATPDRTRDVINDKRTAYDKGAYGAPPSAGKVTSVATLKKHDGHSATYLETGATFDSYGRPLTATDLTAEIVFDDQGKQIRRTERPDGRTTTTVYTPASGLPTQISITTPPAKTGDASTVQTTTTRLEPLRGQPATQYDPNNKQTDFSYDALGRSTKVWLPNRSKVSKQSPNYEFSYTVEENAPVVVGTKVLAKDTTQVASYTLYDGFLRPRQTQAAGPDNGRLVSDTFYDERGLTAKTFATYYAQGKPGTRLFRPDDALSVESQTWNIYDALGRLTESRQIAGNSDGGKVLSTTQTIYGGDRTTVIPPAGGTATTTVIDARGQTRELRQLHAPTLNAEADVTRYDYTPSGQVTAVTDPAGNTWTSVYDQLGHKVSTTDPDKGTTTNTYDDRNQLVSTANARTSRNSLFYVYDGLGRKTELREGSTTGTKLAEWIYDSVDGAKGRLGSSTRYEGGRAYTSRVLAYDPLYRATRTTITIPDDEDALAGTYQFDTRYNIDGTLQSVGFPKAGSLPGGGIAYAYDAVLRPVEINGSQGLRAVNTYSLTGQPLQARLSNGAAGKFTQVTNTYEWGTQRLATSRVDREGVAGVDKLATYNYDEVGNVRSISDVSRFGTDTQCFTYDYLRRISEAWAQGMVDCSGTPAATLIGGPAPYWNSYTYDTAGNRLTETRHALRGGPSDDTKRTYTYPSPGTAQPHALASVSTEGPGAVKATETYAYDETGNTRQQTAGSRTRSMSWDAEGHLAGVTEVADGKSPKNTSYLYDTDGKRLISRTDGETTLYLGATEVTLAKGATTPKATRYIDLGGGQQAVQSDDGKITFTIGDHQGTGQLAINADDQTLTQRRTDPFGAIRGEQPKNWPGSKGFVGGTTDASTGLTHLGVREYDPATGRFLSVDPVIDVNDPLQMNGYAYGHHSPVTRSDPTGLYDPDEMAYCRFHGEDCDGSRLRRDKSLTEEVVEDGRTAYYDDNGVPHVVASSGDNTEAEEALAYLNKRLEENGTLYRAENKTGEQFFFQDDKRTLVHKGTVLDKNTGKQVVTGTTADFIKVTWVNGEIVSVETFDALGSNGKKGIDLIANDINNKMDLSVKGQTQNVVFVAHNKKQAQEVTERFADNPNVRVILPSDNLDSHRGRPINPKLRGGRALGIAGGVTVAGEVPLYMREYGLGRGSWELTKDFIDPFGAAKGQPDPFFGDGGGSKSTICNPSTSSCA
ncbi:RHS repeat-associated core domain-containing protein [Streptomyces abikoensis]|uniref:RHS repeat-associated core domain-containing protein n=1 Tax=Streptomyces abikoensis TaxID=97398 RepID=UPI003F4CF7E4